MRRVSPRGESTEDAFVRSFESDEFPERAFELCIPLTDPETGGDKDVYGNPATLIIEMVAATVALSGDEMVLRGFVSRQDLEYEVAYRRGDFTACMAARDHDSWAHEYVREEWTVPLASRVLSPD